MKRHLLLQPLSREHHDGLILSRLLQKGAPIYKGLPTDINEKAKYAMAFYENELLYHFNKEEKKLLPLIKGFHASLDDMCDEILKEHTEIKHLFQTLTNETDIECHLNKLGLALENHIRKEERVLFPLIEKYCDALLQTTQLTSLSSKK